MTPDRPTPPSRPGRSEPWRLERVVQRVPAHLGENTREPASTWLVLAGIVLLVLVSCGVLAILLNVPERLRAFGAVVQATPTRTPRAATPVTTLPVTVPPPSPSPGPTANAVKYKVKSGDTLSSIALRYRVTVEAIKIANGLKDETIRVGDELVIPSGTPTPAAGGALNPPSALTTPTTIALQAPSAAAPSTAPSMTTHKVARGDTLISIAAAYGSTVEGIRLANQLTNDMLAIGQVLQVPMGAWSPTAMPTNVAMVTATPTPQFAYAAPSLLWPSDGLVLQGNSGAPTLSWTSPAVLKTSEYYVVHLEYVLDGDRKTLQPLIVRQGNSVKLEPANYPDASGSGAKFSWYVVIVSNGAEASSGAQASMRGPGIAASPPSPAWSFTWR